MLFHSQNLDHPKGLMSIDSWVPTLPIFTISQAKILFICKVGNHGQQVSQIFSTIFYTYLLQSV
jgi:hypothetical protein